MSVNDEAHTFPTDFPIRITLIPQSYNHTIYHDSIIWPSRWEGRPCDWYALHIARSGRAIRCHSTNVSAGGCSGFGAAIAKLFANEGAKVLIGDINLAGAEAVISASPSGSVIAQQLNVTQRPDWDAAVERIMKEFGQIDILINNAGTSYKNKPTLDVTEAEYARCFDVNCLGIFHSVSTIFPIFVKQKAGVCINVSSCGASRPRQGLVWYNASKGAVSNVSPRDVLSWP